MKKMTFREFLEIQASLMPAINFAPGTTAFYDLLRAWNTIAILFPEKCANVIAWEKGGTPAAMKNDLNIDDIQATLKTKKLENLPDNLRSGYTLPQKAAPVQPPVAPPVKPPADKQAPPATPQQPPAAKQEPPAQADPALDGLPPEVRQSLKNTTPTAVPKDVAAEEAESKDAPETAAEADDDTHVPAHAQKKPQAKKSTKKGAKSRAKPAKSPRVEL